jgi:CheY-like chemotaxis protein
MSSTAQTVLEGASNADRILVVDDDSMCRRLIRSYLLDSGARLDFAGDGERALELFGLQPYRIVLMDSQMPGIVALTASTEPEEIERLKSAGCDEHLAKPIGKDALIEAISRLRTVGTKKLTMDAASLGLELAKDFLDASRGYLDELTTALAAGDHDTIRRIGHRLRGTGATFGYSEAGDIGEELETLGTAGNLESVSGLIERLRAALGKAPGPMFGVPSPGE